MAVCRLSLLVLLKSTIYPVFYYSRNSSVTGVVEYLIPRMELMGRLPRYMGWAHSHPLSLCQQSQSALLPLLRPLLPMAPGHHCPPKLSNCALVPCWTPSSSSNIETDQQPFRETPQRINVADDNLGLLILMTGLCTSNRPSPLFS